MIVILRQLSPTDFNEVKDKMQEDKLNIALEKQKLSQMGTTCDHVGPLNKLTVHNSQCLYKQEIRFFAVIFH